MPRSGKVRPRNPERRDEKNARNFAEEAKRVRAMPCLACLVVAAAANHAMLYLAARACHVTARGMGGAKGGRFDIVPLCDAHHREAGEAETSQRADFERRHGLDLRAEADRIALEHPRPLGIRGLADRFALGGASFDISDLDVWERPEELDTYELEALLGWVRREMAREVERRAALRREHAARVCGSVGARVCGSVGARELWDGENDNDREALAHHVAQLLGGDFTADHDGPFGVAWSLCEAAGWPS